jgi:membrane-bound serine protease (ClpP class)
VATGAEAMVGEVGVAKTGIAAEGRVFVHGEWWNARAAQPIAEGAKVRIVGVDGLLLDVAPADGQESAPSEPGPRPE